MSSSSCLLLALETPGNLSRDLALFRRSLFARLGEASALALPELAPLALAPIAGPGSARWPRSRGLEGCWKGIAGDFSSSKLVASQGQLYLSLEGPIAELSQRARDILADAGLSPEGGEGMSGTLEALRSGTGLGIFLCSSPDPGLALAEAEAIGPPGADFRDCSLVLLGLHLGPHFESGSWKELARAKRRTGRDLKPA